VSQLDTLLALQERDLALDRLRHRRATLPERETLAVTERRLAELRATIETLRGERDAVAKDEQRLDDEARSLAGQAATAEQRLYSGEISSPRELQALQTDVEQLRRHQRGIEDRELALMERREPLDAQLQALDAEVAALEVECGGVRDALAAAEAEIDAEAQGETGARDDVAAGIDAALVADYEECRSKANGVGAAQLVGNTCQGCHLSIPATEVDRIRKGAAGPIAHCDNCGTILVP
jgi:predicted  nucleic acid-binding Zn-ribbon protein